MSSERLALHKAVRRDYKIIRDGPDVLLVDLGVGGSSENEGRGGENGHGVRAEIEAR